MTRLDFRSSLQRTVAGHLAFSASMGLIFVLLARMGTPETVGEFSLALATVSPVVLLTRLKIQDLAATDLAPSYAVSHYLWVTGAGAALASVVVWIAALALGFGRQLVVVVLLVAAAKAAESFSQLAYGLNLRAGRADRVGNSLVLRGALGTLAVAAGMWWGGLIAAVAAMAAVWAVLLVVYDLGVLRRRSPATVAHGADRRRVVRLTREALPLGLTEGIQSLNFSLPRLFLESATGAWEVGIFSAIAYLVRAGWALARGLAQVSGPGLASGAAEADAAAFREVLGRAVRIAALTGGLGLLAAILFGRPILGSIFGPEYAEHTSLLVLIMVYGTLLYVTIQLQQALIALRRLRVQLVLLGLALAATLAAGALLIGPYGMLGAALTLTIAVAVWMIGGLLVIGLELRRRTASAEAG